jgi:hypothetical protein
VHYGVEYDDAIACCDAANFITPIGNERKSARVFTRGCLSGLHGKANADFRLAHSSSELRFAMLRYLLLLKIFSYIQGMGDE